MQTPEKNPGPDHPIAIEPLQKHVTVRLRGETLAESDAALSLKEADYKPVIYIPRADVRMDRLEPSPKHTHCPYKGDASYFSLHADGSVAQDGAWSYEEPTTAVPEIAQHIAFYPDKVDIAVA